jgi:predicted Zn-dependent peptidase
MTNGIFSSRPRSLAAAAAALVIFAASLASAQPPRTTVTGQRSLVSEFDVNGLKVLVKRRPGSMTVAAGLFFRGGTRVLPKDSPGLENFMLSVATEGSRKYPRTALRRELASTGSNISGGSNYDFSVLALASTREYFERTWDIFTDIALNPAFDPADVDLTRSKIITGLQGREDDPDNQLQRLVDRTLLLPTSYGEDPNGTIESLSRYKAADLRSYHSKLMETSRMLLVIVGDLDAEMIRSAVTASFGKLPRGNFRAPAVPKIDFERSTLDVVRRDLPTNYVNGMFPAPSLGDPDYPAMRVAINLLRERVFEEVRVKRNLSYAPNADMGTLAANTGSIYVTAVDANQAVSLMLDEIEDLKTTLVDPREISAVGGHFLTTYLIERETNAAQARDLATYELIGGGWGNSFNFLESVQNVTPVQVRDAARKYMKNIRFMVIGNPQQIDRARFIRQ